MIHHSVNLIPRLSPEDEWDVHKMGESLGGFVI